MSTKVKRLELGQHPQLPEDRLTDSVIRKKTWNYNVKKESDRKLDIRKVI